MSGFSIVAAGATKALFYCSLLTLGLWLVWYGQYQWGGYDCKVLKPGAPGGHPAGWSLSTPCAVTWTKPLLQANLGFLFLVPAVAALSAVFVIGLRVHDKPCCSRKQAAVARLQCWGSIQLSPKRFWLWWCDGLSVKDAFIIAVWVLYNAVWFSTILSKALARAGHEGLSPRGVGKGFASLMGPNVVLLLLPVARGSVISQALGLAYPEGVRYHRWVGQLVALLATLHGFIYWFSWAAMGTWTRAVLRNGPDLSHLFGGLALICTLLLWTTSQEPFRRKSYQIYKVLHHIGFWGFMIMGCAHYWSFFWYFVPGMLLYAVDGVFRLHQMFAGRSGSLTPGASTASVAGKLGMSGVNAEALKVDVCPSQTMCSLLLAAPEFGVAPAGIVWLNVPAISLVEWHAFDYTASEVTVSADGRFCSGTTADIMKSVVQGDKKTALSVHIKAYSRWTKSLVSSLAQRGQQQQHLTIRLQGPYADPPAAIGQPDGIAIVAGGNGIASALPVFEELSASGVATQGLPALLLWACRKGYEFEFMAAPVLAAAQALGLNLTVHLYITDLAHIKGCPSSAPHAVSDTMFDKDQQLEQNSTPAPTLAVASASSASSGSGGAKVVEEAGAPSATAAAAASSSAAAGAGGGSSVAGPTSLCPVVAFASCAAQLSFKAVLHLAVFAGFLLGLFIATYVGGALPLEAGQQHWPTYHLGPALVLIPAGCAVGLGLIILWAGLFAQRRMQGLNAGLAPSRSPAAAIASMSGCLSELLPVGNGGTGTGKGKSVEPASFLLRVPSASGSAEVLPVVASMPSASGVMQGWVNTLLQLPSASAAKDPACGKVPGRFYGVVYACGPTPLDHATQLAVASITAKHGKRGGSGGCRQVMLQFVRKAQML